MGGSIGRLTAALLLRKLGFDADVFERTPTPMDNRGGGLVLQPIMMKWFDGHGTRRIEELSTAEATRLRYLGSRNVVLYEGPFEWRCTSWGTVYRSLLSDFGGERYHLGSSARASARIAIRSSSDSSPVGVRRGGPLADR